jgi:hypothetical protein
MAADICCGGPVDADVRVAGDGIHEPLQLKLADGVLCHLIERR